jgi:hypothetical protein
MNDNIGGWKINDTMAEAIDADGWVRVRYHKERQEFGIHVFGPRSGSQDWHFAPIPWALLERLASYPQCDDKGSNPTA